MNERKKWGERMHEMKIGSKEDRLGSIKHNKAKEQVR